MLFLTRPSFGGPGFSLLTPVTAAVLCLFPYKRTFANRRRSRYWIEETTLVHPTLKIAIFNATPHYNSPGVAFGIRVVDRRRNFAKFSGLHLLKRFVIPTPLLP